MLNPQPPPSGEDNAPKPAADVQMILGISPVESRASIPRKWRWHHRTLLCLEQRILGDHGNARRDASEPLESHSMNLADSATDEYDHGFALSRIASGRASLSEIRAALRRIRDGSYGICEATGKPIAPARLKAIPWARYGKDAEERREVERVSRRSRFGLLGPLTHLD